MTQTKLSKIPHELFPFAYFMHPSPTSPVATTGLFPVGTPR